MSKIVETPGTCGGRPRIDGTRIAVDIVEEWWAAGATDEEILEQYPDILKKEDLQAVKDYLNEANKT